MADKELRQHIIISPGENKGKVRIGTMSNSSKGDVTFFRAMQGMREEMDKVWKDFFEKNPDEKEEVARRWLAERLRSVQNSKDQHKAAPITVKNPLRKKLRSEVR